MRATFHYSQPCPFTKTKACLTVGFVWIILTAPFYGCVVSGLPNRWPLFTNICPGPRIVPWHMSGMRPPIADSIHTYKHTLIQMQQGYSWPEKAHSAGLLSVRIADITCVCVWDCPFRDMPPMNHRNLLITATELEVIFYSVDLEIKMTIWIVLGKAGNFALWIILSVSHSVWLRWLRVNECIL